GGRAEAVDEMVRHHPSRSVVHRLGRVPHPRGPYVGVRHHQHLRAGARDGGGDAEGLAPWARRCGAQCDLPAGVPGPVLGGHPVQGGLPVRAARPPRDDDGDAHARLRAWLRRCSQVSYSSGRSKSSVQSSISTKWPRLRPGHRHTCPSGTPAMTRYHWLTRLRLMRPRRRRPVTWSMPRRASLCASGASAIAQFSFQRLPVSFEPFSRPYTVQSATSVVVMVVMAWSDSQMSPNTIAVVDDRDHRCAEEAILSMSPISDRKSTRLNSSHAKISYAVVCLDTENAEQPAG